MFAKGSIGADQELIGLDIPDDINEDFSLMR